MKEKARLVLITLTEVAGIIVFGAVFAILIVDIIENY